MSNVGMRIYTQIQRPDPALLERLRKVPAATLDDQMGRIYAVVLSR